MNTNGIHIIFDPGHANYDIQAGKCSPVLTTAEGWDDAVCYNGRFREGMFNRDIVRRLTEMFTRLGYTVHDTSPEDGNVTLQQRVRRANDWCKKYGTSNCIFVSIHANAAGNGKQWMSARGVSVHTCHNCSARSEQMARHILDTAVHDGFKGNRANGFCKNNFYVVKHTLCPAVLVENLFYDNRDDIKILMSTEGRAAIAQYIFVGLCNFINEHYKNT